FSQWRSLVWIGGSLQQFSQILLSLLCMLIIERYLKSQRNNGNFLISLYALLSMINGFTGGGWIALFITTSLFFTIRKCYKLLTFNIILYALVSLIYFYCLSYTFIHRPHPSVIAYIKFILGFYGSVYYTNQFSYYLGAAILLFYICNLKLIFKYNSILLWIIFFTVNPVMMAFSRAGMDPNFGLASHYSTYSAINIIFLIAILSLKTSQVRALKLNTNFLLYVPALLFCLYVYSYHHYVLDNDSESHTWRDCGLNSLCSYDYLRDREVYSKSNQLGIYRDDTIENIIKRTDTAANTLVKPEIINNSQSEASLDSFNTAGNMLFSVKGWIFIPHMSTTGFNKYIILSSANNSYGFFLLNKKRPDVTKYFKYDLGDAGFDSYISTADIKSGLYDISLFTTNGKFGSLKLVKKGVKIN
ncbi:MAG TPA: hypothetical protein VKR58_14695, partial [Aquella sp.]|nr:hypothetical protein [Aquella sp.]